MSRREADASAGPEVELPKPGRSHTARFFLRGLATLLPVVLTIFVFVTIYQFVTAWVVGPINSAIYWGLEETGAGWTALRWLGVDPHHPDYVDRDDLPFDLRALGEREGFSSSTFLAQLENFRDERQGFLRDLGELCIRRQAFHAAVIARVPPVVGILLSILLVLWIGWLVGGFVGRKVVGHLENLLVQLPGFRSVYPSSKQIVEFFLAEKKVEYDTVAAVEYPSAGIWSLGFVTNRSLASLRESLSLDLVSVFIPSSPMPMTGYTIHVPRERVVRLDLSVEEALRITVSAGVLVPPRERVESHGRPILAPEDPPHGEESR